jgi:hypothetical protein
MWKAEEQIPILYQVSITGFRSPDVKGRRTNTYFIPGEHYRLPESRFERQKNKYLFSVLSKEK